MSKVPRPGAARLTMLEPHKSTLEKCVYCPKLCRASCPVSNVEPTESLTPWGKMSASYFLARGDLPLEPDTASVAWGCTGCMGCRERCDHKNDVATTLRDARAEAFARAAAPEGARRIAAEHRSRASAIAARVSELRGSITDPQAGWSPHATSAVLVGCGYHLSDVHAADGERLDALALRVVASLLHPSSDPGAGAPPPARILDVCCGAPLLDAGDQEGFARAAETFAAAAAGASPLVVVDPGCAKTIQFDHPRVASQSGRGARGGSAFAPEGRGSAVPLGGSAVPLQSRGGSAFPLQSRGGSTVQPTLLVDLASANVDRMKRARGDEPAPRYHDPCQLARGLGRTEEPRRILEKVAGAPAREFQRNRALADCSGAGGLLPVTMPEASRAIAGRRVAEHRESGGGTLVTACAASLRRFRANGERAEDLIEWIARGLGLT